MTGKGKARLRAVIRGAVQGVGFRPFIFRLAGDLDLTGWVCNTSHGVLVEVEGSEENLAAFRLRVRREQPPLAAIQSLEASLLDPCGYSTFQIRESREGVPTALILPDVATCRDCLKDILDPQNRRYRYPFTNCTNCGPRFSIIQRLPYDRANTTMRAFQMCPQCRTEYDDPGNRRFHAQPNACPTCGPKIRYRNAPGEVLATRDQALHMAVAALQQGEVLALKGLGGFHLMVDATREAAIQALRSRKRRQEKPLAVMFSDLEMAQRHCEISRLEAEILTSPEAPILLVQRRKISGIAESVAPENPLLGAMLPSTPLHHLLLRDFNGPLVATSGNLSGEPICRENDEAQQRLGGIADFILDHDRAIARSIDDSVLTLQGGREVMLRRARGYAPLPLPLPGSAASMLAVGSHLKACIALSRKQDVFISQHVGDLDNLLSLEAHREAIRSLSELYAIEPKLVIHDRHPDYASTRYAQTLRIRRLAVQHHYAHLLSCMTENELDPPVLGVIWDGTGYGLDGEIWGGEFLVAKEGGFERRAAFRSFPLPGSETAIQEPRRTALGLLYEMEGPELLKRGELAPLKSFSAAQLRVLMRMLQTGLNSPRTSAVGRLFDAVSSLLGIRQCARFEGQAAMELEFKTSTNLETGSLSGATTRESQEFFRLDWAEFLSWMLAHIETKPLGQLAAEFHLWLVETMVETARIIGIEKVALSGGCFQNRFLTERAIRRLEDAGFKVYWHQRVPPNDGGLALGQIRAGVDYLRGEN